MMDQRLAQPLEGLAHMVVKLAAMHMEQAMVHWKQFDQLQHLAEHWTRVLEDLVPQWPARYMWQR